MPGSVTALRQSLKELRDQGADPSDIVVLSVSRADLDAFRNPGGWTPRTKAHPKGDVLLETIHSFKGRDSAIVVLTGLEHLADLIDSDPARLERLLYVGASRARSLLIVLVPAAMIPYLTGRIAE
jgi:hypothetical protein